MSLQATPLGERTQLALFGRRNAGKSSVINALTGQPVAIVSEVKGTTTDPVRKAMELLPLGPVVLVDTPGLDDEGVLGEQRVARARDVLRQTDIVVLVIDSAPGIGDEERALAALANERKLPWVAVFNKADEAEPAAADRELAQELGARAVYAVSATTGAGIDELKLGLATLLPDPDDQRRIVADLLQPGDVVVLVTPIDDSAPKGRLILPQQQTIRDILDADAVSVVVPLGGLRNTLEQLKRPPRLVITDSQVFGEVAAVLPAEVPLTSFSILFARYKGDLSELVRGARAIDSLRDGDRILVSEGCTHHRQDDDIGTVKIPRWLREYTGRELTFEHRSGMAYPPDLSSYALLIHCGACMLNRREMQWRIQQAKKAGVPIVNYGVAIAHLKGILERCIAPLGLR